MQNTDYNTRRNKLVFKEYGRNIQRLVEYAVTIKNDEERLQVVHQIIDMMGQLNPHLKKVDDFKHKLWDHIHILSDFKLQIDSPYEIPKKEDLLRKPDHIGYPKEKIRFKHYGKNVEHLIKKACAMEDKEKQTEFAECIANYMKLVYSNWNKESVSNELIIHDLYHLSGETLKLDSNVNLDLLNKSTPTRKKKWQGSSNRTNSKGHSSNKRRSGKSRR